jgi:hypothetical protein
VILDHSGAVYRHGLPEDHVQLTLHVDRRAETPAQDARKSGDAPRLRECPKCSVLLTRPPCPCCGWMPAPRRGSDVDCEDGELGLVIRANAPTMSPQEQLQFYRELRGFARERGYADGWAFHQCKRKGFTPPWDWRHHGPLDPSPEVRAWGKSRVIAFAKSRAA